MGVRYVSGTGDLRGLSVDLSNESERVGARAATVIRKTASNIVRDTKSIIVRDNIIDTGNHLNSVSMTVTGDGRHGTMTAVIGPTSHYGIYLELGTSRMAARPHLFPAADRHEPGFIAAMTQAATPKL